MTKTIEKIPPASELVAKIIGDEIAQPPDIELLKMTLLAIHDCVQDGLLDSAERAAESLVHQVRLLRLKQFTDASGVVKRCP